MDGRLGDDPQAALAAEDHLPDAGPGRGRRDRPDDERASRGNHPEPPNQVGDIAIPVGLHTRGAGRDPAAQRRIGERIREVAEGVTTSLQLLLQLRSEDPRPGLVRDASRRRPRARGPAVTGRRTAPDGTRPPGPPTSRRSTIPRQTGSRRHRGRWPHAGPRRPASSSPGRTTASGIRAELAATLQDQVADRFATSVDDAVARVKRHVHVADGVSERVAKDSRQPGSGTRRFSKRGGGSLGVRTSRPIAFAMYGASAACPRG